jgi:hypothetical protein
MCKKSLLGITYSGKGVLGGLDGLGDGTDLVDLEQQGVARLELDGEQESTKDETITYPTIWKSEVL